MNSKALQGFVAQNTPCSLLASLSYPPGPIVIFFDPSQLLLKVRQVQLAGDVVLPRFHHFSHDVLEQMDLQHNRSCAQQIGESSRV